MRIVTLTVCVCLAVLPAADAQDKSAEPEELRAALTFHASFDDSLNANFGKGDRRLYSAKAVNRSEIVAGLAGDAIVHLKSGGRHGGALHFRKKTPWFPFYKGQQNIEPPRAGRPFSGTVSFWMQLDPERDLPEGYVDPIQITDKKWNDAAFFVDFTQKNPRTFRLGAYSNYRVWNPKGLKYDDVPESDRPLIPVQKLPFEADRWTHVCFVWDGFNQSDAGTAVLYLDGNAQGVLKRPQQFTWNPERVGIMLGINYGGKLDDLAIFNRALSASEVKTLSALPQGIHSLHEAPER